MVAVDGEEGAADEEDDNDDDDDDNDDDLYPVEKTNNHENRSKHFAQRPHVLDALDRAPPLFTNQPFTSLRSTNSISLINNPRLEPRFTVWAPMCENRSL